jgi:hypothetical protein
MEMLICNKRKFCEKKNNCSHAIKHLPTKACGMQEPTDCPIGISSEKGKRKCKISGASSLRTMRKSEISNKSGKVKEAITKEEAIIAFNTLRNIALVERRMSGEHLTNKSIVPMEDVITGLDMSNCRNLFPDAVSRGLDRNQIRAALLEENKRRLTLRMHRRMNRTYVLNGILTYRVRENTVFWKKRSMFQGAMHNYFIKTKRNQITYFEIETVSKDIIPLISVSSGRRDICFKLRLPKEKILRLISNHLVICDYENKNSDNFPCFAVTGSTKDFTLVATVIENGKFVDPFFMGTNPDSKAYQKKKRRKKRET